MKYNDDRIKADFRTRLKKIMEIRNVNATDVCQATGIAKSTYSQYMSGRNEAKADRVHQLAKYFDVSEAWLIGYDAPMERSEKQKKNDNLAEIIVRLRNDDDFSNCVNMLNKLQPHQYESIKQLLSAFSQK